MDAPGGRAGTGPSGGRGAGQRLPRFSPRLGAEGHERVECGLSQGIPAAAPSLSEQAAVGEDREIEHRIADRYPDPWPEAGRRAKDAVRKVLDRKVRAGGDVDEGTKFCIQRGHFFCRLLLPDSEIFQIVSRFGKAAAAEAGQQASAGDRHLLGIGGQIPPADAIAGQDDGEGFGGGRGRSPGEERRQTGRVVKRRETLGPEVRRRRVRLKV